METAAGAGFFDRIDRGALTARGAFFVFFTRTNTSSRYPSSSGHQPSKGGARAPAAPGCRNLLRKARLVCRVGADGGAAQDGTANCVIARLMLSGDQVIDVIGGGIDIDLDPVHPAVEQIVSWPVIGRDRLAQVAADVQRFVHRKKKAVRALDAPLADLSAVHEEDDYAPFANTAAVVDGVC